jgi:hypothetical protein
MKAFNNPIRALVAIIILLASAATIIARIRRRMIRMLMMAIILFGSVAAPACDDREHRDTLREIARAIHRVANATARADEVTYRFFQAGVINGHEAEEVSIVLNDINTAVFEFEKKARGYAIFDGAAKADILRLASDTRDYINGRIKDGSAHIKDERARQEWQAIINTAYDSFASIVLLVRAAKPAPTPTPGPAK